MSFGFSVSDFVALGQLAWQIYKSCKESPKSFKNISQEVLSLHAVLKEVEEILSDHPLSQSKGASLATITRGCQDVLQDLQSLVRKYERLASKTKRTWDRLRWHSNDIAELRARLTSNIVLLTAYISTSQITVQRQLNKFMQEFKDREQESSVITTLTIESLSIDDKQRWRSIRKELEDIGISVAAFDANKGFILEWFKDVINTGAFEEQTLENDSSSVSYHDDSHQSLEHLDTTGSEYFPQEVLLPPSKDAEPLDPRWTALHKAAESGHEMMVQLLLEEGADVAAKDGFEWTALHAAAKSGHETVVPLLLEKGADVAAKDHIGRTALHRAAENGHETVVRLLLEKGAGVAAKDNVGRTALYWAAEGGHETVVQLLHEKGADIAAKDKVGRMALHRTAEKGQAAAVRLLLEKGVDVTARDRNKRTPLHWAAENGYEAVVRLLHEKGADIAAKDNVGRTALDWAAENGQEAMVRLLATLSRDSKSTIHGLPTIDHESHFPFKCNLPFGLQKIILIIVGFYLLLYSIVFAF